MANFNIDRLKFRWRGEWSSDVEYRKDDIVYYKGKTYVCKKSHIPDTDFYNDRDADLTSETITVTVSNDTINSEAHGHFYLNATENPIITLLKGRTYTFNQDSGTNVSFNEEPHPMILSLTPDGIFNGGNIYTEGTNYLLDGLPVTPQEYISGFENATVRRVVITVPNNIADRLYYASGTNSGMGNYFDTAQDTLWEKMFDGNAWKGDWATSTFYSEGDIVKFKGYVYQCIEKHSSVTVAAVGLPGDALKWTLWASGNNWLNTWSTSTNYDLGDVVRYNGTLYLCNTKHLSATTVSDGLEFDNTKWTTINRSQYWTGDWQTSRRYIVDDIVKYGGIVYICTSNHTSADSFDEGLEDDIGAWEIFSEGIEYKGNWATDVRYKLNDVVKYGGMLWKANVHHASGDTLRADESNWDVFIPGTEYEVLWTPFEEYNKGDVVRYGGYVYTALENNINSVPSVNGILQDTGSWELLNQSYRFLQDWDVGVEYRPGDVVRFGGHLYVALLDNIGGEPDQDPATWYLLLDGREHKGEWDDNTEYKLGDIVLYKGTAYQCIQRHLSTSSDSRPDLDIQQDDQDYWIVLIQGSGNSVMAARGDLRVHDGTDIIRQPIGQPGRVAKVSPNGDFEWGSYEEIPQVFYVSTSGVDSDLNGKSLGAPFRTVKYACEYVANNLVTEFVINWTKISDIITAIANSDTSFDTTHVNTLSLLNETIGGFSIADINNDGSVTTDDSNLISDYNNDLISEGNNAYDWIYENIETRILRNPSRFRNEPEIFSQTPQNATIFIKTGFYEEELPISIPKNTALVGDELRSTTISPATGFETSNMFYVRNGSGIRNMTLQGLNGTLGDLNGYLTRRPTAGAYVSLDPGTGADDESVWIINKSPYVQNVTTFGTGCIGMKIDGALHAGGNDSIVANDFTQVLDDGIGYWATNNGRSELVSVFTYFCHIGYLAENGGILRATNGNNSYGEYGSVAEGVDEAEVPITATVNNRDNEATVQEIFTYGTLQQRILAMGYSHAGENYSSASVAFDGSGLNASGSYSEIRDGAISNIRLEGEDSTIPGGLNYTFISNNAQDGNTSRIRLSAADVGEALDYIGQRIVITSGLGVGQYAEIADFDPTTKIVIVARESDGSNGWDHFQPGWPIEPVLDETTTYTIEPRVEVEEKTFSVSAITECRVMT